MPIDRRDLIFLSQIPFQLSGEEHLSPRDWCFYLSFNWGIHKNLPPSTAQKILTLALEEKILEKENETLTIKERIELTPLYKLNINVKPDELVNIKPYSIKSRIEFKEVELKIQQKTVIKEKRPPIVQFKEPQKAQKTSEQEIRKEKSKEDTEVKEKQIEEETKQKTKPPKKSRPEENKKAELTLDHFTKK
ncbi:MAG: hypothetical protein Q6366_009670 [Candidatus Freyarchaeota archaeon]